MASTMLKSRNVGFGVSVIVAIAIAEFYIYSLSLSQSTRAIIFRTHFVIIIQCVMFLASRFVWRRVGPLFDRFNEKMKGETTTTRRTDSLSTSSKASDSTDQKEKHASFLWRAVLLVYLCICHLSYLTNLYLIGTDPAFLSMLCYTCLGSFVHLVTGLIIIGVLSYLARFLKPARHGSHKSRSQAVIAVIYALSISTYGSYKAHQPPIVKTVEIPVQGLPTFLDGLRIVQLTDIHLGPTVGRSKLNTIVSITNQLKPDVVVVTGDLVDGWVTSLHEAAQPLEQIQAAYGRFYVTGNHEYYTGDVENWFTYLRSLGYTVLHNSNTKIKSHTGAQGELCVAGTDDIDAERVGYKDHGMNLHTALGSCDPKYPTLLLAHQPRAVKRAFVSDYRVDVALCGHTHGGQMFPLIIIAYFGNPYFAGLYQYGPSSHVYVSMGTVYWGIPMRVFSTREISHIILRRA